MRTLSLLVFLGLGAPALAQEPASTPPTAAAGDEVVVEGRRSEPLRVEIERLENAVYKRWNELNANEEFDIHCREMEPTGSNIPLRTCAPQFVIDAESDTARNVMMDGRSTRGRRDPSQTRMLYEEKSRKLTEEMQRVAREDEKFLRDLVRLDELKQQQASEKQR